MNHEAACSLDSGLRRQPSQLGKCFDELRPAIGVAAVVDRIDSDEEIERAQHLCPAQGQRQEDRVACRHIGDRDAAAEFRFAAVLRHVDVVGECRAAELPQVDLKDSMLLHAERLANPLRRLQFKPMPLTVVDRQSVQVKPLLPSKCQHRGGIESAADKNNGFGGSGIHVRSCSFLVATGRHSGGQHARTKGSQPRLVAATRDRPTIHLRRAKIWRYSRIEGVSRDIG